MGKVQDTTYHITIFEKEAFLNARYVLYLLAYRHNFICGRPFQNGANSCVFLGLSLLLLWNDFHLRRICWMFNEYDLIRINILFNQ